MQLVVDMTRRTFLVHAGQGSIALAKALYVTLGALRFETLLVGPGEPILDGAAAQVAAFAAAA